VIRIKWCIQQGFPSKRCEIQVRTTKYGIALDPFKFLQHE
jgi:hypothetical protein